MNRIVYLKELIEIKNGKDYKHLSAGNIPVYGSGGIIKYVNDYLYDGESILLPRKGTLDNICYVDGKVWTVDTMYWTIINKEIVYPKYLYCYLSLLDLSSRNSGSTLPSMTFNSYYSIPINIVDYEIQKNIGDLYFIITKKINKNEKIIKKLNSLVQDLYNYWFNQFNFPNENGIAYKFNHGKLVWNRQLKKDIPKRWKVLFLKDCIKHINTGLNPRDNFKLGDGSIKYVTVKNLTTNGTIDFSSCDVINEKARKIVHKRSDVSKGDILFASIAPLGRCVIVKENPVDWDINESVFCIRPDLKKVSTEYLYSYFMSDYFIKKAEHSSTGSIFSGIRVNILEEMPILIPNKKVMTQFTNQVSNLFEMKSKKENENEKLISLRNFLLPLLMNGQITFKD